MTDSQFENEKASVSSETTESKETFIVEEPTDEEAYSLGVEQGRIMAIDPESQGQVDWPLSCDLSIDDFRPIETGIGQVAAPPVIYADNGLMNAYCTGVLRGFSDYHASQSGEKQIKGTRLYRVPVVADDVSLSFTGYVNVYAINDNQASDKVQAHIYAGTLDDDLQMEDADYGNTVPYINLNGDGHRIRIDDAGIEVVEDDVERSDLLETEIKELLKRISWSTDSLTKHKAFLESLLKESSAKTEIAV